VPYFRFIVTDDRFQRKTVIGWGETSAGALAALLSEGYMPDSITRLTVEPWVLKWGQKKNGGDHADKAKHR
jgi:hypothetical protein